MSKKNYNIWFKNKRKRKTVGEILNLQRNIYFLSMKQTIHVTGYQPQSKIKRRRQSRIVRTPRTLEAPMIFSCFHWEFHIYRNDIPKSKKEQGNSKRGVGGKSRSRIDLRNPRFKPSDNKSIFWGFLSINWHSCPRKLSFFFLFI